MNQQEAVCRERQQRGIPKKGAETTGVGQDHTTRTLENETQPDRADYKV